MYTIIMKKTFGDTFYIAEKSKIKVSAFVMDILNNDAQAFGFIKKNDDSNINGLLNKLLPTLFEVKKLEQIRLFQAAQAFNPVDAEKFCEFAEIVFDSVYFCDIEFDKLESYIWIRPSETTRAVFDEIIKSELPKAAVEFAVYIRRLLNRYARLPQYKREALVFDSEFETFYKACLSGHILHFRYKDKVQTVFAYDYSYGYSRDQKNYLIGYNIDDMLIQAYPLCEISKTRITRNLYHPSEQLIECLAKYQESCDFQKIIAYREDY